MGQALAGGTSVGWACWLAWTGQAKGAVSVLYTIVMETRMWYILARLGFITPITGDEELR